MPLGYVPTAILEGSVMPASIATPLLLVVALPILVPFNVNVTVLTLSGVEPATQACFPDDQFTAVLKEVA